MDLAKRSESQKLADKWKERRASWPKTILTAGLTGFFGSLVSAIAEMNSWNLLAVTFGAKVVIFAWLGFTGGITVVLWGISTLQYKKYNKKDQDQGLENFGAEKDNKHKGS